MRSTETSVGASARDRLQSARASQREAFLARDLGGPLSATDRRLVARESLRRAIQATPGGVSAPTLPRMADLVSLSPEELLTELRQLGLTGPTGEPLLEMRALRARLRNLALDVGNGTSRIDAEALRGEMGRALHDAISQGIKEVVGEVGLQAQLDAGAERSWPWAWLAVADDDTCAPCEDRHGEEKSLDEWERDGMPRAPRGVCQGGGRCRCEVVPIRPEGESAADEDAMREAAE